MVAIGVLTECKLHVYSVLDPDNGYRLHCFAFVANTMLHMHVFAVWHISYPCDGMLTALVMPESLHPRALLCIYMIVCVLVDLYIYAYLPKMLDDSCISSKRKLKKAWCFYATLTAPTAVLHCSVEMCLRSSCSYDIPVLLSLSTPVF